MYNKVLKQILWASAFLALAFFIVDIAKVYIEFTPDRFKLSLSQIFFSLFILLTQAALKSIVLVTPLLVASIALSFYRSARLFNLSVRLNAVFFFMLSFISITFYFFDTIFNKYTLKILMSQEVINGINIKYSIFVITLFISCVTLVCFKKNKSINLFQNQRRGFVSLLVAMTLIGISFIEITSLKVLRKHKVTILNYYEQIVHSNDTEASESIVNYKDEFKKYLDLNEIYEKEKNYLKLLKRKTSSKIKNYSVVMFYVDYLSSIELIRNIDYSLFTFEKVVGNYSDPIKSIRYIKLNLPPLSDINVSNNSDSVIKTHYSKVFKGYGLFENNTLAELPESLHFSIFHLKFLSKNSYFAINEMIKKKSKSTIFVFTTNSNDKELSVISKSNYLDRSTFISFYIPKSLEAVDYKINKVIGQEDIMTTLYNLALSEKEYLSLGDDIFIDSNSNGINEKFCIDDRGVYLYNKNLEQMQSNNSINSNLSARCKSTKHLTEFILKQSLNKDQD